MLIRHGSVKLINIIDFFEQDCMRLGRKRKLFLIEIKRHLSILISKSMEYAHKLLRFGVFIDLNIKMFRLSGSRGNRAQKWLELSCSVSGVPFTFKALHIFDEIYVVLLGITLRKHGTAKGPQSRLISVPQSSSPLQIVIFIDRGEIFWQMHSER